MALARSHSVHAVVKSARRAAIYGIAVGGVWLAFGFAASSIVWASPAFAPSVHVATFDRFIEASGPVCQFQAARLCVDLAWDFADGDGDDRLSVSELRWIRVALRDWVLWRDDLPRAESAAIAASLLLAAMVGTENLHRIYDLDGDGWVDRNELLADVTLDERPIGEILLDPASFDHQALARKLGLPSALVDRIPALVRRAR
jgi:hypothetical protein